MSCWYSKNENAVMKSQLENEPQNELLPMSQVRSVTHVSGPDQAERVDPNRLEPSTSSVSGKARWTKITRDGSS